MKKKVFDVKKLSALVFALALAVGLAGCDNPTRGNNGPTFDERLFGTWVRDTAMRRTVWEFRRDWTSENRNYDLSYDPPMMLNVSSFTVNADIFIVNVGWGILYYRFSLPDANTLVMANFRITWDEIGDSPAGSYDIYPPRNKPGTG